MSDICKSDSFAGPLVLLPPARALPLVPVPQVPFPRIMMFNIKRAMSYRDEDRQCYSPLHDKDELSNISVDDDDRSRQHVNLAKRHRRRQMTLIIALVIAILANVAQLIHNSTIDWSSSAAGSLTSELFWNPFEHLLKYHVQVFPTSFPGGRTAYMGAPTKEMNERWRNLYVEAFTLPKEQAAHLVNKTTQVDPTNPDSEYVTSFSTMHFLHCLDGVRQMVNFIHYPSYTNQSREHNQFTHGLESFPEFDEDGMLARDHIEHCVDHIRLALMCKPDLSPVVWQWRTAAQGGGDKDMLRPMLTTAHSCANYDAILEYAQERVWEGPITSSHALDEQGECRRADENCGYPKAEENLLFDKDNYATQHGILNDPNNNA